MGGRSATTRGWQPAHEAWPRRRSRARARRGAAEWEDFASERRRAVAGAGSWHDTSVRGAAERAQSRLRGRCGFAAKLEIAAAETEPPDLEAEPAAVATAATTPAVTPAAAPATAEASSCPDAAHPADATDAVPPALAASDGAAEEWGGSVEAAAAAAAAAAAGGGGGGGAGTRGTVHDGRWKGSHSRWRRCQRRWRKPS